MARTIVRDRSEDLVRSVQLADRTGIIAASAPKPVETYGDDESAAVEFAPASGQLDIALSPVVVVTSGMPEERRLLRRVRRNLVVGAAAVVLLGVGWIAGDTFGFDRSSDLAPTVAAGIVPDVGPAERGQPIPSTNPAPAPRADTQPPMTAPPTTRATQPVQTKVPSATDGGVVRSGPVDDTPAQDESLGETIDEQIRQLFEVWTGSRSYPGDHGDVGRDRSAKSFGPLGR